MGLWVIPLLGNFPRLLNNRSRAFITIPSIIIHALNCLALVPYLSSRFQEEALGQSRSDLWLPVLCISFTVVRKITTTPDEAIHTRAGGAGQRCRSRGCSGRAGPGPPVPRCPTGPVPVPSPGLQSRESDPRASIPPGRERGGPGADTGGGQCPAPRDSSARRDWEPEQVPVPEVNAACPGDGEVPVPRGTEPGVGG